MQSDQKFKQSVTQSDCNGSKIISIIWKFYNVVNLQFAYQIALNFGLIVIEQKEFIQEIKSQV